MLYVIIYLKSKYDINNHKLLQMYNTKFKVNILNSIIEIQYYNTTKYQFHVHFLLNLYIYI